MPELPEVESLARFLDHTDRGAATVTRAELASLSALKTFDPPLSARGGLDGDGRRADGQVPAHQPTGADPLVVALHLARGGWVQWRETLTPARPKPGKGPLALRVGLDDGSGFDVTEQGTEKRLAIWVVHDPAEIEGVARLGPDPLDPGFELGPLLEGRRAQLKGVLTDQSVIAGIGNAYSDEALHIARLSPFKMAATLTPEEVDASAGGDHPRCCPTPWSGRGSAGGRAEGGEDARACGSTAAPASPVRSAATPSARCRSPRRACSTARPARRAASPWPTGACRGC